MKPFTSILRLLWLSLFVAGWTLHAEEAPNALEQTFQKDPVALTVRATPATLSDLEDVTVTLLLTHPEGIEVTLPIDYTDRFEGLRITGSYEGESVAAAGTQQREYHIQARPIPGAERLRIAPFPIRWKDPDTGAERWFPTRAILFMRRSTVPDSEAVPTALNENLQPIRIHFSARELLRWSGITLAGLLALALLFFGVRYLRLRIRLARMAPRERALLELQQLLEKHLAEKGLFKQFYVELTHVVRRYIERRHGIRAPKQTTEEFLQMALQSGSFPPPTLQRLQDFLTSADLVKFAGISASEATARESAAYAQAYLEAEPKANP